ncbi:hypothetical protein EJ06DRAFT_527412 [Trichodelitschia bisporula]|uniref:Uncharacterized protein n=1 Tax=Trichodelitschia bisporula TaxID=703511 RepID=A0A6G1I680_9PEZI|nr:hypothetical protein EJ06DRAFT_527412 [Trichodelitschia bisporula]
MDLKCSCSGAGIGMYCFRHHPRPQILDLQKRTPVLEIPGHPLAMERFQYVLSSFMKKSTKPEGLLSKLMANRERRTVQRAYRYTGGQTGDFCQRHRELLQVETVYVPTSRWRAFHSLPPPVLRC